MVSRTHYSALESLSNVTALIKLTVHLTAIVCVIFPYPDLDVIKEHDQIWLKSPCNYLNSSSNPDYWAAIECIFLI
ncbi:hypothetical protein F7Q91_14450 [Vibrio chagasii]|uniref:Uncharacterized protein n=1 Tax=Vibrio chagasii TaxID=170679 RepID=A0A7V7TI25_9VIBR|nr:hypothetical protein F7Q91_14450 [Vibrio chagasii]CAH6862237.1 conserved hypothetical protein [Vibrio chagasii]CAH7354446.1 conserved hypothetical protein [Vibrio chagasii]